jgi:hypothetical protein
MQSPKSKRAKAPGEKPASDNNPVSNSGGTRPERHGSSLAKSKAHVPKRGGTAGNAGGVQSGYSAVPVHSPAPHQGGGPSGEGQRCNPCGTQRGKR